LLLCFKNKEIKGFNLRKKGQKSLFHILILVMYLFIWNNLGNV